jgi:hypothetical protein
LAVVVINVVVTASVVGFVVVAGDVEAPPAVVLVVVAAAAADVSLAVDVVAAAADAVVDELIRPRMVLSVPLTKLVCVARAEERVLRLSFSAAVHVIPLEKLKTNEN